MTFAQIDLTQIILAVITLIDALISRYLIPWLKAKLDDRQTEALKAIVRVAVYAGEQLFESSEGKAKKAYVLNLLTDNGFDVDSATVDALIEATVKELKIELSAAEGA